MPDMATRLARPNDESESDRAAQNPKHGWEALRAIVFKRDKYTCTYCWKSTETPHCDHVIPKSRGGVDSLENLTTACPACNLHKSARTPLEWFTALEKHGLCPSDISAHPGINDASKKAARHRVPFSASGRQKFIDGAVRFMTDRDPTFSLGSQKTQAIIDAYLEKPTDLTVREPEKRRSVSRPNFAEVKSDVAEIKRRLGFGQSVEEIQDKLGLTRRQFKLRMRWVHAMANDATYVWVKYISATETTLKTLSAMRQIMLDELQANRDANKKFDKQLAKQLLTAQRDIQKARKDLVEVGQSLGQYDRVAEKTEITAPLTLGDILGPYHIEEEVTDVEAEIPEAETG